MDLKIGMKVRQTKDSPYYHQSKELTGIIIKIFDNSIYYVRWSHGITNSYLAKRLEIVGSEDHGHLMLVQEEK